MGDREIKRTMVTKETQVFLDRFRPPEDNSHMSCILVLLMAIDVAVLVPPMEVPLPLLLYPMGLRLQEK
jgi:hypothetical protein